VTEPTTEMVGIGLFRSETIGKGPDGPTMPEVRAGNSPSADRGALQNREFWTWARSSALWSRARRCWVGEFWRQARRFAHELWHWPRREHVTFPNVEDVGVSIAALHTCVLNATQGKIDADTPIFLLSTGWRTGSTLLQRILVTDPQLLLWGEPLGEMTVVSRITEMVSHSLSPRDLKLWRTQPRLDNLTSSWLATSWIGTLSPPGDDFRLALRSIFDQWLGEPARRLGFARWGLKEVRLGAAEASLLYWLYPNAKFVMLSRHPYDCYVSLSDANWHPLHYNDLRVDSAAGFARHWNRLAVSWSELPKGFPSCHIKYEDLISGKFDFRKLESWLGIELRENVALSVVIGHSSIRPRPSWYERWIIAREAGPGMRALGYSQYPGQAAPILSDNRSG